MVKLDYSSGLLRFKSASASNGVMNLLVLVMLCGYPLCPFHMDRHEEMFGIAQAAKACGVRMCICVWTVNAQVSR